jgi:hypothetical protein
VISSPGLTSPKRQSSTDIRRVVPAHRVDLNLPGKRLLLRPKLSRKYRVCFVCFCSGHSLATSPAETGLPRARNPTELLSPHGLGLVGPRVHGKLSARAGLGKGI